MILEPFSDFSKESENVFFSGYAVEDDLLVQVESGGSLSAR